MLRGIDVSHWQGNVNWALLKQKHGLTFGFCKANEGSGNADVQFRNNWAGIDHVGMIRGAYHFARPVTSNVDKIAEKFVDIVNPSLPTDLLVLDLETGEGLSQQEVRDYAIAWAKRVRQLVGYKPGLYCGGYMDLMKYAPMVDYFSYWWYPRYPSSARTSLWPSQFNPRLPSPNIWGGPPDFWQWSATFYSGQELDANVFEGSFADLRSLNTQSPVNVEDDKPPIIDTLMQGELMFIAYVPKSNSTTETQWLCCGEGRRQLYATPEVNDSTGLRRMYGQPVPVTQALLDSFKILTGE